MRLSSTQSLVTGAGSGMGLAVARRLAGAGSAVHSFDVRPSAEPIDGVTPHTVDIRSAADIARGMDAIQGKLHVLFNNAGILVRGGLFDVSQDQLRDMIDINVIGSWQMLKTALEGDKLEDGATVVQMCSVVGGPAGKKIASPKNKAYGLTKTLVHELILALREERPDLRIKGVYPGAVKTPMTMAGFPSEQAYDEQAIANWGVVSTADELGDRIMQLIESDASELYWDAEHRKYVLR